MEKNLKEIIFKTLAYADIFDYPLKAKEIWRGLILGSRVKGLGFRELKREILRLSLVDYSRGYYFFKGRGNIVSLRLKRERWSREKFQKAQKTSQLLKFIPTIKMAAVTGSLAVENCDREDDIDLLIVTSAGTLWLTRFLATLLLEILGQRRHPGQKRVQDKICLNMFVDENHLQIPPIEQDLYTAHEVVQLKLLWDRGGIYQKFLAQNRWVKKYLPNTLRTTNVYTKSHEEKVSGASCLYLWLSVLERLARHFQLWYMRKRRTTEVVSEGVIRFHPQDARTWIFDEYQKRIYHFPIDK